MASGASECSRFEPPVPLDSTLVLVFAVVSVGLYRGSLASAPSATIRNESALALSPPGFWTVWTVWTVGCAALLAALFPDYRVKTVFTPSCVWRSIWACPIAGRGFGSSEGGSVLDWQFRAGWRRRNGLRRPRLPIRLALRPMRKAEVDG